MFDFFITVFGFFVSVRILRFGIFVLIFGCTLHSRLLVFSSYEQEPGICCSHMVLKFTRTGAVLWGMNPGTSPDVV